MKARILAWVADGVVTGAVAAFVLGALWLYQAMTTGEHSNWWAR